MAPNGAPVMCRRTCFARNVGHFSDVGYGIISNGLLLILLSHLFAAGVTAVAFFFFFSFCAQVCMYQSGRYVFVIRYRYGVRAPMPSQARAFSPLRGDLLAAPARTCAVYVSISVRQPLCKNCLLR